LERTASKAGLWLAAALCLGAAADNPEIRRAAAFLDYVARGYPTAVAGGQVINAQEHEEQKAFAQEAAEILERTEAGKPFASEAREVERQIRAKAAGAEALAASVHERLLKATGLDTTPPPELVVAVAPVFYQEACAACHGADGRGDGFAAAELPTKPTDFTGPDRDDLTPYRVYSAILYGVPHTAMPAFESMTDERRWQIALYALTFGYTDDDARRGERLAREKGLVAREHELIARSDRELRAELAAFSPDGARALIAWARRIAPFTGPPAAGFQDLRNDLAMASVDYVHGRPQEAQRRLRDVELSQWVRLEPLVLATPSGQIAPVRRAFAVARARAREPDQNTRLLGAVAQLAKQVARAGPEELPDPPVLRRAGLLAALWNAVPAAAVLCAALLISRRPAVSLLMAIAGAALGASHAWPWQAALAAQLGCAAALLLALRIRPSAAVGAGLSAFAAGAEIVATRSAMASVYSQPLPEVQKSALLVVAGLAIVAISLGFALRRARLAQPIAAIAAAATTLFWGADRLRLWW